MLLEYFDIIDRVVAYDPAAKTLTAQSVVPSESPVFEEHFPGHPLVPGVLLTETMAQACGYLLLALNDFKKMPFLMTIDAARFRTFVEPDAPLEIEAEFDMEGSGYAAAKARIRSEGKAVANSALRFRLMDFPGEMEEVIRGRTRAAGLDDLVAEKGTPA